MGLPPPDEPESDPYYVLVTGANSGVGFGICCRLVDEFLHTRRQSQHLFLIITTRDSTKGDDTVRRLRIHLHKTLRRAEISMGGISKLLEPRIHFLQENVELTDLRSVQALAKRLLVSIPRLNTIILNAGIAGMTGVRWPRAIWTVLTDVKEAINRPCYKITRVDWTTKPQTTSGEANREREPPLGQVFCANIFGHYLLTHYLLPLLSKGDPGRIIWMSSIEAHPDSYNPPDIQAIASSSSYESCKRVTDILALTSRLPSASPWVDEYLSDRPATANGMPQAEKSQRPRMYVGHPGICGTNIVPLPLPLVWLMLTVFYFNRLIGNPWALINPYKGACAPVWLALAPQETLDASEKWNGIAKWGSAVDRWGHERVQRTEVEGWGFGGRVSDSTVTVEERSGRRPGAKDVTPERRAHFEELGREIWQEMEKLRDEWELRLGDLKVQPIPSVEEVAE